MISLGAEDSKFFYSRRFTILFSNTFAVNNGINLFTRKRPYYSERYHL